VVFTILDWLIIDSNSVLDDTGGSFLWVLVHRYFIQKRHASPFRFWRERGLAQSIFQLGGNTGSAIGPLLVANCGTLWSIEYHLVCARGYFGISFYKMLFGTKII
jgi:hypothetical protein